MYGISRLSLETPRVLIRAMSWRGNFSFVLQKKKTCVVSGGVVRCATGSTGTPVEVPTSPCPLFDELATAGCLYALNRLII